MNKQSGIAGSVTFSGAFNSRKAWIVQGIFANVLIASISLAGTNPTIPPNISVTGSGEGALVLSWNSSFDADGVVVGYELIKNGSRHWLGNVNWYQDHAVSSDITYAYNLIAVDDEGNRSAMSDTVTFRFSGQSSQSSSGGAVSSGGVVSVGSGNSAGQSAACVDPDGDGWGWDGQNSCKMEGSNVAGGICIDEDGDGYGWDGFNSCLVGQSHNQCIDSDGDGFGWDGHNTCVP